MLGLAEQTRLGQIIAAKVSITSPRIKSSSVNPAPKLLGVIARLCAGSSRPCLCRAGGGRSGAVTAHCTYHRSLLRSPAAGHVMDS
jgi:hypothetical protein